jgi:hypothetical protein
VSITASLVIRTMCAQAKAIALAAVGLRTLPQALEG